jgi:DNA-directed RNA polymerase subunit RPC12/RpoP
MKNKLNNLQTFEQHSVEKNDKEPAKIKVECVDCGKDFTTTQEWFDKNNKAGKLSCRKCRTNKDVLNKDVNKDDKTKIEVECRDCGKKFTTTQAWFDQRNVNGKLPCRKCRTNK